MERSYHNDEVPLTMIPAHELSVFGRGRPSGMVHSFRPLVDIAPEDSQPSPVAFYFHNTELRHVLCHYNNRRPWDRCEAITAIAIIEHPYERAVDAIGHHVGFVGHNSSNAESCRRINCWSGSGIELPYQSK